MNSSNIKKKIINEIIVLEGRYSNHINDSGGRTCWGITEKVARGFGYKGSMRTLPKSTAVKIYSKYYWNPLKLDKIAERSEIIARELMDTAINMGNRRAGRFLQTALNALNNKGKFYPDCVVDGLVGQQTIFCYRAYLNVRGNDGVYVLHKILNSLQGAFYIKLTLRREKDETFLYGWFKNRVT